MFSQEDGVISVDLTIVKNPPKASAQVEGMDIDEFARRLASVSPDLPWIAWTEAGKHHAVVAPTDAAPPGVYVQLA